MTTSSPSAGNTFRQHGASNDRAKLLLNSWLEKASKRKGLLSTVSILPLAACGGGNTGVTFQPDLSVADAIARFGASGANSYSIEDTAANIAAEITNNSGALAGATEISLSTNAALSVAEANAFAALDNFVGFNGNVTMAAAGGATAINAGASVDQYTLVGATGAANTLNVFASNVDVDVIGADANDAINVGGLTVSGNYTLGAGTNAINLGDGGDISAATITAIGGSYSLALGSGATVGMTVEQHNAAGAISGAGSETIELSNAGTLTGDADIESYVLADGNDTFTLGANGQNVDTGAGTNEIITGTVQTVTGTLGGAGTDTLTLDTGDNISGADVTAVENATVVGAVTMTLAQHNVLTLDAAGGADTVNVSTAGTLTGDSDIENYVLATGGDTFTLGATAQNVDTGLGTNTIITAAVDDIDGTLGGSGTDTLVMDDVDDITGANVTAVEHVTVEGSVAMTAAQHTGFTTMAAAGTSDLITLFGTGNITADADVETYILGNGGRTITLAANSAQTITGGGTGTDTIAVGGTTFSGTVSGVEQFTVTDGGDITGVNSGTATGATTVGITGGVTMTAAQHNGFTTVNATGGADQITVSTVGTLNGASSIETYKIQAASELTLGAFDQDVTELQTAQQDAASTLVFGSGAYTGTFVDFGTADVLSVVDGTDISGGTGLDVGVLDFGDANATITLDAVQNGSLTILGTGADSGAQAIRVDEIDTFTGDVNIETYEIIAGSTFTLGSLSQSAKEIGISGQTPNEAVSTVVFRAGAYTGSFVDFDASDILKVVNGTDFSDSTIDKGSIDFQDANAALELSVAQHNAMTLVSGGADSGTQTFVLSDAGSVTSKANIEQYNLSDDGTTTFTQGATSSALKVLSGARNDLIISNSADSSRDNLSVDLTSGGNDTVRILNDTGAVDGTNFGLVSNDFGGFGGSTDTSAANDGYNENSLSLTAGEWDGAEGTTAADILGFMASATDNDRDMIQLSNFTGGVVENVNRTTTDLTGIASGSVLEINTASYTVAGDQFGALNSVATMLDSLSNVADGEYYIVAYNGSDANADAALYYARATEGDGFDFADTNGSTGGYDTDSLELLAVFHEVGANELSSLNFEAVV